MHRHRHSVTSSYAESVAWRAGKAEGLFPGVSLCNSHGTLDRRGRLQHYVDEEVSSHPLASSIYYANRRGL